MKDKEIQTGYIYILKDEFYEKYDKEKILLDNKRETRPYYYCFKKDEMNWVIPISHEYEKYKDIMDKDIIKRGFCNKVVFTQLGYKKEPSVLLIQNMFPVFDKYFLRNYEMNKLPCKIEDMKILQEINSKAKQIYKILEHGKYFLKSQQKVIELKQELINELKINTEIDKKTKNLEVKSKKIEFENEETGKKIYVEMIENDGKKEVRASQSSEPFNQEPDNYIKYGSIIDAAAELIKNGFVAKKEKNIEEKKLDQNFNEILKKKAQELENKKNDELEIEK